MDRSQAIYVHEGSIVHQDSPAYAEVRQLVRKRDEEESYRLLYVAASRARDVLLMTGSSKGMKTDGWLSSLELMKLGPGSKSYSRADFTLQTHLYEPQVYSSLATRHSSLLEPAPWIDRFFSRNEHPPVSSPSRVKQEQIDYEPLPFSDPDEGERLPGRSTTVGTLVHYAISQNWSASNPTHLENLKAQEVMFPFSPEEQEDILAEVIMLLANYESLLGQGLAALTDRLKDYPELPMAIPQGKTVWQGIIDRLYHVNGQWFLEDYKTDQDILPEKYFFQLGVYLQCIQQVKGVKPQVQLVFLREKQIISVAYADLEQALKQLT